MFLVDKRRLTQIGHGNAFQIDGSMQERRNSIANALELRLSCINPSEYEWDSTDLTDCHGMESPG